MVTDENRANDEAPERANRRLVSMKIDFIVDADIIPAESINLSKSGISFKTRTPIKVVMRFSEGPDVIPQDQSAELVWAQKSPEGETTYGLRFIEDPENPAYPGPFLASGEL
jgi:hypothetical protein